MMIPFNKPYLAGNAMLYINEAVESGKISGNGMFTNRCENFFQLRYGFKKTLLTTSCTDALEMCAMLADIGPGDEVIVPSYTFVSSALAFARQGATIVFADSRADHPGIDEKSIESLITNKTKAIVPVHYAGFACNMDVIMDVAERYNLIVIEDAAQAIDSYYTGRDGVKKALGSIGHLGAFSFHETKNIQCGEGGLLAINDDRFVGRAEIIWEKGTNRAEFFRGEVNKYGWVDTGSSFLPSEILAAFLWSQLESLDDIQSRRVEIFNNYYQGLTDFATKNGIRLPLTPPNATVNGHMFYLVCESITQRTFIIDYLKKNNIFSVFHYLSLHQSDYYKKISNQQPNLPLADFYSDHLLRLPLYYELDNKMQEEVVSIINQL